MKQIFSDFFLHNVHIGLRDDPITTNVGISTNDLRKKTPWVAHIDQTYYESYIAPQAKKLAKFFIKRNGLCFYSEFKTRCGKATNGTPKNSFCATFGA